jgi:apolipoprotein N-acyltransferase
VRSANTGISGIVDPYGHVVVESRIFEPAVIVGDARFLQASTFYTRHGNLVAYVSVAVALVLLLHAISLRRMRS